MKKIAAAAILLVLGWVAWPYWSAWSLASAVRKGDVVAIEDKVDWEPLRANLRDQVNTIMMAKLAEDAGKADGMGALGAGFAAAFAPKIIEGLVNSVVTPQGVARLVKGETPAEAAAGAAVPPKPEAGFRYDLVRWAFLTDPTTFRVDMASADGGSGVTTLQFKWAGSWKLAKIFLPEEAMGAKPKP